jgi:DNA sulfur modification protein DndB
MSILIPAIQGRFGNTDYYQASMKARDLVQGVRPPSELDDWQDFGIEERMQRDPMMVRIKKELAPYLARNADRFFGSIIVLVYKGDVAFESVTSFVKDVPNAYKKNAQKVGFLTIDGGTLIVLDGQHRLLAERMVLQQEVKGPESASVGDDEICVIFIKHESNIKTRRIFNTVNRYAKPTSRGDNIITSEDDAYAIVARRLMSDNQPLRAVAVGDKHEDVVNWKSNTLSKRSTSLTTISVVYETVKAVLSSDDIDKQERPDEERLDEYLQRCAALWGALLTNIKAYSAALADLSSIPAMREDTAETSLLFKPAAQIALFGALLNVSSPATGLSFEEVATRANQIADWSMTCAIWKDIIIKSGGSIDNKSDATERLSMLLTYLLAADKLPSERKLVVWRMFNQARHPEAIQNLDAADPSPDLEPLPVPVVGKQFTVEDAMKVTESTVA